MVTKIGKTFKHYCLLTQHLWHYVVAALIRVGNFQPTPKTSECGFVVFLRLCSNGRDFVFLNDGNFRNPSH